MKKFPEEKRQGEKEMAQKAIKKDSPFQLNDKAMRKKAAAKKLKK